MGAITYCMTALVIKSARVIAWFLRWLGVVQERLKAFRIIM